MLEFGRMNQLKVHAIDEEGAWLRVGREEALLSSRELNEEIKTGDMLTVFVYVDMSGQPVATLKQPIAEVGEFALMRASQVNAHGAFMDWGLAKIIDDAEPAAPSCGSRSANCSLCAPVGAGPLLPF